MLVHPKPHAARLLVLLDQRTRHWHDLPEPLVPAGEVFLDAALQVHRANFDLWHQEDEARNPDASDERIAAVKRAIDTINQSRNDLVEALDLHLVATLSQNPESPLHSETPGMIVDRLSILSLKIYHTEEETRRAAAGDDHRQKNRNRLAILLTQRSDLAACLDTLLAQIVNGERRFNLYRQMKMYNDPDLNPVLYRRTGG